MTLDLILYYIGILIIFITHISIIYNGGMDRSFSVSHAYLNLTAGFLIAFYFIKNAKTFY